MMVVCKNVVHVWLHWHAVAAYVIVFSETEFNLLIDNVLSACLFFLFLFFIQ